MEKLKKFRYYLQDDSTNWEDDMVDIGSLEEVFTIVCLPLLGT